MGNTKKEDVGLNPPASIKYPNLFEYKYAVWSPQRVGSELLFTLLLVPQLTSPAYAAYLRPLRPGELWLIQNANLRLLLV